MKTNPTQQELEEIYKLAREVELATAELEFAKSKLEIKISKLREACDVPPGILLHIASGKWIKPTGKDESGNIQWSEFIE